MTDESVVIHDADADTYRDASGPLTIGGGGGPPTGAAGGVLSGTYPNPGFAADMATQAELDAHTGDTTDAHDASAISADSTTLVGTGTDVQAVLEELDNGIADHLADTSDAHDASAISFVPAGTIAATDVQAAIEEVAAEAGTGTASSFGVEVPAGTVNGSNDTFTLSEAPDPSADLLLWKNGLLMKQGLDYTLVTDTVTFDAGQIPQTGDILLAAIPTSGGGGSGVDSIAKSGDTPLTGDVTLSEGSNVTLTQVGQDIEIAASGGGSGYTEIGYTEFTSPVSITATVEASANTVVTASAFTADGSSAYLIEFFAPDWFPSNGAAGRSITIFLFEDGSSIGKLAIHQTPAAGFDVKPVYAARRRVPASGSRTYSVRAFVNAGTGSVEAGTGGTGNAMPGYIRITKVT